MPIVDYATCAAGNAKLTYAKVDDEIEVCSGYGGNNPVSILLIYYLFIYLFSYLVSLQGNYFSSVWSQTLHFLFKDGRARLIKYEPQLIS